jgi:hypothetical protein
MINIDKNILVYENFITDDEQNILLKYAKEAEESQWAKVKYKNEELLKKSPDKYKKYLKYVEDWDKTTLYIDSNNHNIVENIKNRSQKIIGSDLLITDDIYRIKRLTNQRSISPHFDDSLNFSLVLGIVIYLNNDFDGGEIYYPNQNISYKPISKSMIIHPATEEYTHGVNEVVGNTRYSLAFFATRFK